MGQVMKILIVAHNQIDKYNWGHELFRREISRCSDVVFFGPGYSPKGVDLNSYLLQNNLTIYDFDFVFTHGLKYTRCIKDIYTIPKDVLKVHYVIDYFEQKGEFKGRSVEQHEFLNKYNPDVIFSVYHNSIVPISKNVKCDNIFCLPFSACGLIYRKIRYKKDNIITTCFSTRKDVYPDRLRAVEYLKNNKIRIINKQVNMKYVKSINRSKISLGVNDIYKSLNMRVTEILSCGGFLLTNKPNYIDELGLVDGKHYVTYKNFDDMADKIKYYFRNDSERELIENRGMKFVRENHSCNKRVIEMIEIVKQFVNKVNK